MKNNFFKVAAFYKFTQLSNLPELQETFMQYLTKLKIKGTILLAHEGINGTVAGTSESIDKFKEFLNNVKALANELFVVINNDFLRALKGSKEFEQEAKRVFIVSNIKSESHFILSIDKGRTICKTIKKNSLRFW